MIVVVEHGAGLGLRRVRLRDRLLTRLRASSLDAELAAGASPESNITLALRAGQLCRPSVPAPSSQGLNQVVATAGRPAGSLRKAPVNRDAVRARDGAPDRRRAPRRGRARRRARRGPDQRAPDGRDRAPLPGLAEGPAARRAPCGARAHDAFTERPQRPRSTPTIPTAARRAACAGRAVEHGVAVVEDPPSRPPASSRPRRGRGHADDGPVERRAGRAVQRGVVEVEDAAVAGHQPVAAAVVGRRHADHGLVEREARRPSRGTWRRRS